VKRSCHDIVEVVHRPDTRQSLKRDEIGKAFQLSDCFLPERSQEVTLIYPGESPVDIPRGSTEIKRHRNCCRRSHLQREISASLAEILEEYVPAERNTGEDQRLFRKLVQ